MIPDCVKAIGEYAFFHNHKITSISVAKEVVISDEAFRGCEGLADQNGFVIVNDVLYDYFGNKKKVVIPDHVVRISARAFWRKDCIKKVIIKENVEIGKDAFGWCTGLADENGFVIVNGVMFHYTRSSKPLNLCLAIPDGVTAISAGAFDYARPYGWYGKNNSIAIPESVKEDLCLKYDFDGDVPAYTIIGKKGTCAEQWAKKYQKGFESFERDYIKNFGKVNQYEDDLRSFVTYMLDRAGSNFELNGYARIICPKGTDMEQVKTDFLKGSEDFCRGYMENIYQYYPEGDYIYESTPDEGNIKSCTISGSVLRIEFYRRCFSVFGYQVPDFSDFSDQYAEWLQTFSKRRHFQYEYMHIAGQAFSVQDSWWCKFATNIKDNRYSMARRRVMKAIRIAEEEFECIEDYSDEIKAFKERMMER